MLPVRKPRSGGASTVSSRSAYGAAGRRRAGARAAGRRRRPAVAVRGRRGRRRPAAARSRARPAGRPARCRPASCRAGRAGCAAPAAARPPARPGRPRRAAGGPPRVQRAQQLGGQVVGRGVDVLEHRVHERAERRAGGQVVHRRRQARRSGGASTERRLGRLVGRAPAARARCPTPGVGGVVRRGGERGVRGAPPRRVERAGVKRPADSAGAAAAAAAQRSAAPTATASTAISSGQPHAAAARAPRRPRGDGCARVGRLGDAGGAARAAAGAAARRRCRRRRPPRDDLALRPGQRDVEQPQLLAGVLGRGVRRRASQPGPPLPADVEHPPAVRASCSRSVAAVGHFAAVPAERHVDDGELQALAGVHGEHLHGGGVGLQPPAALVGARRRRGRRSARPASRRARVSPSDSSTAAAVQHLRDVPQVGEQPLPADRGEQPALAAGPAR